MRFLLLDRDEQYIGPLKQVISARNREVLNGENVLTISTFQHVEKNYRILYKDEWGAWQEFIIRGIDEEKTGEGIKYSVFAESSFYETLGDYIEDKRAYETTANVALAKALEPTRWEVGIVDDLGLGTVNFYHISAKEAVQRIISVWKCELRTRVTVSGNTITHRYVDLLARRGADRGKRFTYTKNLINVTKMVHREDVITALYGYGRGQELYGEDGEATGGYGRRLTFGEINNGLNYVANETAREIWGRNNQNGSKSHVFGKVEFDDCDDQVELLNRTLERLEEVSKPLITYKTRVLGEDVSLGDDVSVIDKDFVPELRLKARVIELDRDLLNKHNSDILLGNFIPTIQDEWHRQVEFINNFRSKQGVWDRSQIIGQDGTINAQYLEDLINEINRRMNAQGGYVYISETGDGLITYDTPNPEDATMAIQLLGGSFRIANSKLPNGEWNWRTFGDGNGFVADAFIGGLLKGGKVNFDLTNGTLLIGDSIEDYRLLFDGGNLSIRLSHGKTIEESIEDVGQDISDSQEYLRGEIDEVNAKVDDVIGLVGEEPVVNIKQQLQDAFERELEAINKALYGDDEGEEGILDRLAALSGDTAGLYIDLADQAALIESLTGKISIEGDTVLIGDAQASKGIRIKPDEIAFLEGESKVAWITGGMLYIDAGVFLTRLKIGNHVFQSVEGNPDITIVGYEP
jgi:phage minor structural protein